MSAPDPSRNRTGSVPPLAGFTVAVTAARRAEELGALLERRGAEVVHAPALRIIPLADDVELRDATKELVARPPDVAVATTGIGFRGWMEAADGWGEGEALRGALAAGELLARGPKACGAIRAAGLREAWSPASESSTEVLERLLDRDDLAGLRIAVQLHGEPLRDFIDALRGAGAEVVPVPVYRWTGPADPAPLDRLLDALLADGIDAVTFTSALAAAGLYARAEEHGKSEALTRALRERTQVACVGPVTAAPLLARDIPAYWPDRFRTGALVRRLCDSLPAAAPTLPAAGHTLQVRGTAAVLDGELRPVSPGPMAVLRALARRPGQVLSTTDLLPALPGGGKDEHAVESAVGRLRTALGAPAVVQTVVKRGYRIALDPAAACEPDEGDMRETGETGETGS
ncbi:MULTISPECIES: uroporphyrinogen-III synthase [unclassified Streptomyces]|uniref:uroporphyrinogen-III synthase n=1 Tax=unclassified Streptomyces TaxID=2593676 RepID=UPI002DD989A8|nr:MULTISPECIES: uroporphyrinogen-III synthase [unclassified Streptomyces]WSA95267.1 uroporphyrinogen-III synthase [Streptomyces sp. NBC_01795]WSB79685.1 uroporphyrinogen-III synthase [Streptomyces sp. NBC_01775]WSS12112.1 uroporphyrinogen-III synthase [Streptomyces sp. NBC_01186]WSS40823.1 uroporphyrinogen-III synthase [Streptomyces sp. NBC_01187]